MNIGIDIRTLTDAQYSGVSEYTFNLIKEMLKLDAENEYQLFYNCFQEARGLMRTMADLRGLAGANFKVVDYHYPNKILNYLLFKFFNWPKIDKKLGADIFFMPHINFIGLTPPDHLCEGGKKRLKSVITVHDLSFLRYPEFFSWRKNFWHKMLNARKLLNRFDRIVAVSENTKRDIVELCDVSPDKVRVIYSGVGEEYKKMTNDQFPISEQISNLNTEEKRLLAVKEKYNLPDGFVLYLCTIEPRKNVDGIIRAYSEVRSNRRRCGIRKLEARNIKLVIAGAVGWRSKKVFQEWQKSKFKDDIKFLGYVEPADKVYLYNLASVFVYPSFYEGFGLPPLEAMASGLPVVCSFAASLGEVAGEAALMVDPYNIKDIAGALAEVLADEKLHNRLTARGLERARKFSWEKTAGEYLALFSKL
jgi:glycosyltransferase involved in cell wall biosynthesis